MIKYLRHEEIDKQKWDRGIARSDHGRVFACSWFLDRMCEGWGALIEGDYESLFPLTAGKKYGIFYLYQPFFTQQLGLFSSTTPDPAKVTEFLQAIPSHFRYTDISLNTANRVDPGDFQVTRHRSYVLDLDRDYASIADSFSENARRNIAKATGHRITVSREQNPVDLIRFFRENLGRQFPRIREPHYEKLHNVMNEGIRRNQAELYMARTPEGALCAGGFFAFSNNRYVFLFSGSNRESRKNGAMFCLVNRFIQDHAGGKNVLDFMGSDNEGMARFYQGFGSAETHYPGIRKNNLHWPLNWLKR